MLLNTGHSKPLSLPSIRLTHHPNNGLKLSLAFGPITPDYHPRLCSFHTSIHCRPTKQTPCGTDRPPVSETQTSLLRDRLGASISSCTELTQLGKRSWWWCPIGITSFTGQMRDEVHMWCISVHRGSGECGVGVRLRAVWTSEEVGPCSGILLHLRNNTLHSTYSGILSKRLTCLRATEYRQVSCRCRSPLGCDCRACRQIAHGNWPRGHFPGSNDGIVSLSV